MYGKHFASMYTGSMYGKPAMVFAIWGYVISHFRPSRKDRQCYVELNPVFLAGVFRSTTEEVLSALSVLESPDPASRSKECDGRRLVLLSDQRVEGPMQYLVVNGPKYRAIRDEDDRREYLAEAQRIHRAKKARATPSTLSTKSTAVNRGKPKQRHRQKQSQKQNPGQPLGLVTPALKDISVVAEKATEHPDLEAITTYTDDQLHRLADTRCRLPAISSTLGAFCQQCGHGQHFGTICAQRGCNADFDNPCGTGPPGDF